MLNPSYTEILECPFDRGALSSQKEGLICQECGLVFPVIKNIPVMLLSEAHQDKAGDYYRPLVKTATESIEFYDLFYQKSNDYKRYTKADIDFIKKIFKQVSLPDQPMILDVGAGTGYFGKLIQEVFGYEIYNSDFSIEGFKMAQEQFNLKQLFVMDAYTMAFKPGLFDLIFAMGLTPFKKSDKVEITDLIKRVCSPLKTGGYFVFVWSTNLTNIASETKTAKANTKIQSTTKYYNHSRKFMVNAFLDSGEFSEINSYVFIRPISFLFGNFLLSKFNTVLTEAIMKVAPKFLSARLLVIGKKK